MTQLTDEQRFRLKQIQTRQRTNTSVADMPHPTRNEFANAVGDIQFLLSLLDSQTAGDDLNDRDSVLAFFGASMKENGNLHIDMKKYHAAHLCQEHSSEPWRRSEIEEKCVMCLARERENAATLMREKCVARLLKVAQAHRVIAEKLKGKATGEMQLIRAEECDILANALSSLTLDSVEQENQ